MANDLTIVVRLSGGLGNQLHQYAYGYYVARKHNAKLCVDTSFYDLDASRLKITNRNYELGNLAVEAEEFRSVVSNYTLLRLIQKLSLLKSLLHSVFKIKVVDTILPEGDLPKNEKLYYVNGVFGTLKEYLPIADDLQRQLVLKPGIVNQLPPSMINTETEDSVAIHVRRSDYLNAESVHEVLPLSYYLDAIALMKTKIDKPVFHLFGDDENWIRENFDLADNQFRFTKISGNLAHLADFFAMRHCQHCIISNSTFAWWAAFLNPNKGKIIVAPGVWLKNNKLNIKETYLTEWHVI